MLRLRYAQLYLEANPSATQEAVAAASGFTSRFALSRARASVVELIPRFVDPVKL